VAGPARRRRFNLSSRPEQCGQGRPERGPFRFGPHQTGRHRSFPPPAVSAAWRPRAAQLSGAAHQAKAARLPRGAHLGGFALRWPGQRRRGGAARASARFAYPPEQSRRHTGSQRQPADVARDLIASARHDRIVLVAARAADAAVGVVAGNQVGIGGGGPKPRRPRRGWSGFVVGERPTANADGRCLRRRARRCRRGFPRRACVPSPTPETTAGPRTSRAKHPGDPQGSTGSGHRRHDGGRPAGHRPSARGRPRRRAEPCVHQRREVGDVDHYLSGGGGHRDRARGH